MRTIIIESRKNLAAEIEKLQPGDCIQVSCLSVIAGSVKEALSCLMKVVAHEADFVSLQEGIDTRGEQKAGLLSLSRALYSLDRSILREKQQNGINRAKEEGKYKGRKPIAIDDELFESVIQSWQSGQITARQAMAQLNLKPNTFYRRIKDRENEILKNYKKADKEIRSEIKEAAKQRRRDLGIMKKQVKAEVKDLKKQEL